MSFARRTALLACVGLLGCPQTPLPGDQPMGQYVMNASGGQVSCQLEEVTGAGFEFEAILTRESTSERAWMTLAGYSREGTFDGQVLRTAAEVTRVFDACSNCKTRLTETITVAVLSRSQIDAAAGQCPADALDGGVAAPNDAGITGPGQTSEGYDAVRLCGELVTVVSAERLSEGVTCPAECDGCTVRYQLRGERR